MNERIIELAEQASKEAFPVGSMAWMEKFAELIVQECMLVITEQSENTHAEGTIEAIVNLEKHFGVGE